MKKVFITLLVLCSIVLLFQGNSEVSADVGNPPTPGAAITPGDKTYDIEMKSEKVVFDIREGGINSPFYSEGNNFVEDHYAHVTADFIMHNVSSEIKTMDVIFPIPCYFFSYEGEWEQYFNPESTSNPAINFKVEIDGVGIEYEYEVYQIDYTGVHSSRSYEMDVISLQFPVLFNADSDTNILIEYDIEAYVFQKNIYRVFEYIMETGSHWKGNIGRGEIIFNFPNDIVETSFYSYSNFFEMSGNQLIWEFSDLEPYSDYNFHVSYSPELMDIWNSRDTYLVNVFSNYNTYWIAEADLIPYGYANLYGVVDGNPIFLLPHNNEEGSYPWVKGYWFGYMDEDINPWVQYEFDGVYEIDTMRITSGMTYEMDGVDKQLIGRPKKVKLIFSDGSEQIIELEDKPDEEVVVNFDKVETYSIRIEVLEVYPDYTGSDTIVGIEELDFDKGRYIGGKMISTNIKFPDEFLAEGSSTTRIDNMTISELSRVENFTLETVGKNKVVFHDTFDFSKSKTLADLQYLSKYVDFTTIGEVMIDSDYLEIFKTEATITMSGLSFKQMPLIYKDGEIATSDDVLNIEYDSKSGILNFDVVSFSTYTAVDRNKNYFQDITIGESSEKINWFIVSYIAIVGFITLIGIVVVLIYRHKEVKVLYYKIKSKYFNKKKENHEHKIKK